MARLAPLAFLKSPLWVAGVFGADKSFADNPILGSPRLNRLGLHRARLEAAAAMATRRRARLGRLLDPVDRAAFDRDGFLAKRDFLPPATFAALRDEIFAHAMPAWEQRQGGGGTVERMTPLPPALLASRPTLAALLGSPAVLAPIRYAASRGGRPTFFLQTVMAGPSVGRADPQTFFHADTFHPTTKGWFFLHDVAENDGPFTFVPGSHRLTPARLAWEQAQALTARDNPNRHHAVGSFRIGTADISGLGYEPPRRIAVPANTLVVADTFGFHARAPSDHATVRIAIHTTLRRNPFAPWLGGDFRDLPGLRGRDVLIYLRLQELRRRFGGRGPSWHAVGPTRVDAAPNV